jgi:hypothetical protein
MVFIVYQMFIGDLDYQPHCRIVNVVTNYQDALDEVKEMKKWDGSECKIAELGIDEDFDDEFYFF